MKQISAITVKELTEMANQMYGNIVKAVIDVKKGLLVVDAEMHVDEEQYLLEHGSEQNDLWGINLHPAKFGTNDFIEFDSMVNIRPRQKNLSRGVESKELRTKIRKIVQGVVKK